VIVTTKTPINKIVPGDKILVAGNKRKTVRRITSGLICFIDGTSIKQSKFDRVVSNLGAQGDKNA
jgi:hypothetical protein